MKEGAFPEKGSRTKTQSWAFCPRGKGKGSSPLPMLCPVACWMDGDAVGKIDQEMFMKHTDIKSSNSAKLTCSFYTEARSAHYNGESFDYPGTSWNLSLFFNFSRE